MTEMRSAIKVKEGQRLKLKSILGRCINRSEEPSECVVNFILVMYQSRIRRIETGGRL